MAGVGRDATDQQEIEKRVRAMAYVDPLTGLANRHLFNQRLRELLEGESGKAKSVALLYLDLDDFKSVNDVHGHIFGDSLLREMGARLRGESRDTDLVARLGGDEFAILIEAPGGDGMLIERAHRLSPLRASRSRSRVSWRGFPPVSDRAPTDRRDAPSSWAGRPGALRRKGQGPRPDGDLR